MKPYVWNEHLSLEDQKNGAYWERNMMVLLLATSMSNYSLPGTDLPAAGWYYDIDNNWDGYTRVISLYGGAVTFHVPDDFNIGSLPEIKPNWDGHSTEEKWNLVMDLLGILSEETTKPMDQSSKPVRYPIH